MIELDSEQWKELEHAYGDASDIPALLKELETSLYPEDYRSEPWFTLWSSLCHQYSIYNASYAVVPHLIQIAQNKEKRLQLRFIDLIGSIHCFRTAKGQPPIPNEMKESYESAIKQSLELCYELVEEPFELEDTKGLLGSIAILKGYNELGAMIYELQKEVECQECGAVIETPGFDLVK